MPSKYSKKPTDARLAFIYDRRDEVDAMMREHYALSAAQGITDMANKALCPDKMYYTLKYIKTRASKLKLKLQSNLEKDAVNAARRLARPDLCSRESVRDENNRILERIISELMPDIMPDDLVLAVHAETIVDYGAFRKSKKYILRKARMMGFEFSDSIIERLEKEDSIRIAREQLAEEAEKRRKQKALAARKPRVYTASQRKKIEDDLAAVVRSIKSHKRHRTGNNPSLFW